MASADTFHITVHGRQTHGARPWDGVDPIVIGAQIVSTLQTIQSRQVNVRRRLGADRRRVPRRQPLQHHPRSGDDDGHAAHLRRAAPRVHDASRQGDRRGRRRGDGRPRRGAVGAERLRHPGQRPRPDGAHGAEPGARRWHRKRFGRRHWPRRARISPTSPSRRPASSSSWASPPPGVEPRGAPTNHSPRFRVDEAGMLPGLRAMLHLVADHSGSGVA